MDAVKGYLTPDTISKVSSFLGENEGGVSKALSGIVPTVLSGFVSKANSGNGSAGDILEIVKNAYSSGNTAGIGNFLSDGGGAFNKGLALVQALFGDKLGSLMSSISSFAGIKTSSAGSLFSIAGPLVANLLGKHTAVNNLNASGLSSFLSAQKANILSALPAGLSGITGLLGLSKIGDAIKQGTNEAKHYTNETIDEAKKGTNWLVWLLVLALAALALWYFLGKGCNKPETTTTIIPTEDTSTVKPVEKVVSTIKGVVDSIGNFVYDIGNETEIRLKDGSVLKVGENSTEAKLFKMLYDTSFTIDTVDKSKNWIVLDRVYFETGKSVLTAASMVQVKNIAAILKDFPRGSIKLGGYTDNTGDASINRTISDERAKIVAKELVKSGAAAKQVEEAVGYGSEFPVCTSNDTPECKAQNRRVDLKVATK